MPTFAVDWDGTCVENVYPDKGDWLPGAKEALHKLNTLGHVLIHTVRIAPVMPAPGQPFGERAEFVEFDPSEEIAYIRRMLDTAGLYDVEIWQEPYKPPATYYIDDRAIPYYDDSGWEGVLELMAI